MTCSHHAVLNPSFAKGIPHERLFKLSKDKRYLSWSSGWLPKFGKVNESRSQQCTFVFCFLVKSLFNAYVSVDLEKVARIMTGQNTFQFTRYSKVYGPASGKSLSIVYLNDEHEEISLNLIAPSGDIYRLFVDGLGSLITKLKGQLDNYSLDALYLKSLWERADSKHCGVLRPKEIAQILSSINVSIDDGQLKHLINKYDANGNGELNFEEFVDLMSGLLKR